MEWLKTFSIPAELDNRPDDTVSYIGKRPDATKADGVLTQTYAKVPCYSSHMSSLSTTDFFLKPNTRSLLPFDIFERWVLSSIENGVMPPGSTPSREGEMNLLHIPANNVNRHVVYAGLCCYRWSENQPGVAYCVVKGLEADPRLDYFQVLHYAASLRVYWQIHSFTHIMMNGKSGNGFYGSAPTENYNRFLPYSVALAQFFRPGKDGVTEAERQRNEGTTLEPIIRLLTKAQIVAPTINTEACKPFMLKETQQVLSPELTGLYRPHTPGELRQAILDSIGKLSK